MKKFNFNLLELVLVIAVFFIMSGIIIPIFAEQKEDSDATLCMNRKKQLLAAITSYANDNNGQFVAWENSKPYTVFFVKGKYIDNKVNEISCPLVKNLHLDQDVIAANGNYTVASRAAFGVVRNIKDIAWRDYYKRDVYRPRNAKSSGQYDSAINFLNIGNKILLGDTALKTDGTAFAAFGAMGNQADAAMGIYVHGDSNIIGWTDGHVEAMTPAQFKAENPFARKYMKTDLKLYDF